jgi:hypothetical protein
MFENAAMHDRQPEHVERWQTVLNQHWPTSPVSIKDRDRSIPVRARIVWARDGEEYRDGVATRWDADHVYVEIVDARLRSSGCWLKPSDVYRRSPAG